MTRKIIPKVTMIVFLVNLRTPLNFSQLKRALSITPNKQFKTCLTVVLGESERALLFKNGKAIITGSKSRKNAEEANKKLIKVLEGAGVKGIKPSDLECTNIQATANVGKQIDLDIPFDESHYFPESFPARVFKLEGATALLSGNGKIVFVGARSRKALTLAAEKLEAMLEHNKLI